MTRMKKIVKTIIKSLLDNTANVVLFEHALNPVKTIEYSTSFKQSLGESF